MKIHLYKAASLSLVFALFPLILACHTPAGRTAGQVVDDSTITTKVKAKLFDDDQLSGFAISVKTFKGEVTLTGAVESGSQKARATILAKNVSGVTSVNNLLQIKP
jgi:hyperosmotically inducible protein